MKIELATFGGGCFWCIETIIRELKGVKKVESGYTGGNVPGEPTYREICSGLTGHAEVVQVTFNSEEISYHDLITVFMTSHDPTTLNRQGADSGTQYRSVIYYHNGVQKKEIDKVFLEIENYFSNPIVTEVSKAEEFYIATIEHQNFYKNNPESMYCRIVIDPKMAKLKSMYASKLK